MVRDASTSSSSPAQSGASTLQHHALPGSTEEARLPGEQGGVQRGEGAAAEEMLPCCPAPASGVDTAARPADAEASKTASGKTAQDQSTGGSGGARGATRCHPRPPLRELNGLYASASPIGSGKHALASHTHTAPAAASKASAFAGCALFPEHSPQVEVTPGTGIGETHSNWPGSSPRLGGPRS